MRHCSVTCLVQHFDEYNRLERKELMELRSSDFPGASIPPSSVLWCYTKPVVAFLAEVRNKKRIDRDSSDC
jgi:hypothetical protein